MQTQLATSVVIPWSNREEIRQTLDRNRVLFVEAGAEVIVVNCGGNYYNLLAYVRESGVCCRCVDLETSTFNKSLALNIGSTLSTRERLFFLDTDIILEDSQLFYPDRHPRSAALALKEVIESTERAGEEGSIVEVRNIAHFIFKDRETPLQIRSIRFSPMLARSGPGIVNVLSAEFRAIGGLNSGLIGWGWEDLDLLLRMQLHTQLSTTYVGKGTHLNHGDDKRSYAGSTPRENDIGNQQIATRRYNQNNFLGTLEADVHSVGYVIKEIG